MWPGNPWLYHSHLSAALNLSCPTRVKWWRAAEAAYRDGHAPLASVEGFIRQILGWREYVRGIYWTQMPDYLERNALDAQEDLPALVLDRRHRHGLPARRARTDAHARLRQPYPALDGHRPLRVDAGRAAEQVHAWYLAVYVDAVEWVESHTHGMGQYADGGVMGSKPYIATGKYIQRMSPHRGGCRFDPAQRSGDNACPFTTLYWDFLMRHEATLAKNPRTALQVKNVARLTDAQRQRRATRRGDRRGEVGARGLGSPSAGRAHIKRTIV